MEAQLDGWKKFYQKTLVRKHHPRTEKAISIDNTALKRAVDCGCGTGADIAYLAEMGYQVFGFDQNNKALDICQKRFENIPTVEVSQTSFENFQFPESSLILRMRAFSLQSQKGLMKFGQILREVWSLVVFLLVTLWGQKMIGLSLIRRQLPL